MKNNKYNILVLAEFNKNTSKILESSISLAKIVDADINFLSVKKTIDVVKTENQLSALRSINSEYISVNNKIKDLVKSISENHNVNINHTFTIGNLKNEIDKYIDDNKPDIIILGKRKSKIINLIGDNLTQFILKKHKGIVVIADDKNALEPNKELSIGMFNNSEANNNFAEQIISATKKPLRAFKIAENSFDDSKEDNVKNTLEYVFAKGDNAIKNISNYLTKSKINLLFVDRNKEKLVDTNIKNVIKTFDCSLILTT